MIATPGISSRFLPISPVFSNGYFIFPWRALYIQKILGQVSRCVEDYHMIDAGDVVAVGVSGGKDSLVTLTALARLRAFYPIPFTVRAIT